MAWGALGTWQRAKVFGVVKAWRRGKAFGVVVARVLEQRHRQAVAVVAGLQWGSWTLYQASYCLPLL